MLGGQEGPSSLLYAQVLSASTAGRELKEQKTVLEEHNFSGRKRSGGGFTEELKTMR